MRRVSVFSFVVLALTVAFWNSPAQAVDDWYWVEVDSTGWVVNGGGSGYNGGTWYEYYDSGWWNEWFYNAPFDPERKKEMEVSIWIEPLDPQFMSWATIAYNWSTDEWAAMGITDPPLPGMFPPDQEDLMIQRHVIYDGPVPMGGLPIDDRIYILDYNPEWVSIDVQGENFFIDGMIRHECQPVKWKQLPDTTPNGIDIKVDVPLDPAEIRWLGDDFKCTTTGPLTGIHFWVSYLDDFFVDWAIDTIHLEIYDDDPAGPGGTNPDNTYSMPDRMLWFRDFTRAEFMQRLYAVVEQGEYWWDPATAGSLIWPADYEIRQIDIDISQDDTFTQEGTPDDPKIYWLVIQIRKNPNYTGEIGWKTRQWPDHFMDDAVFAVGIELPRIWEELRYPPGHPYYELERNSIDLSFVIQGKEEKRFEPVKWSQPPVPDPQYPPEEKFYLGWDEESVVSPPNVVPPRPFCADDFYCLGPKPVTKIHWWGSFRNWPSEEIPPAAQLPQAFQIGFWTDVPAHTNPDIPYSHPGEMVWEVYCQNYELEFYGWDVNPWSGITEAKFQFNQDFLPEEWFHQDRENEIYWVSIAADYGDWSVDPQYIWGWETRPHMFQDDAVKIYPLQANVPPHPGYVLDPFFDVIEEIIHPDGTSWDLAYELGTDPDYIKWEQRFDPLWDWNMDIKSQARYDPATPEQKIVSFEAIVADDWPCRDERPILAIEWWGSYLGFDGSAGIALPQKPDFFLLTIWTDMPADPLDPQSYSHPDQLVWTYRAHNYVQVPVGKETINNEVVFQYFVNLPVEEFFFQEPDPDNPDNQRIYWLSVVAVYPDQVDLPYDWGWTNHEHVFMDDAAYDDVPTTPVDPWQFDWKELQNPTSGETWDMSFVLETAPECYFIGQQRGYNGCNAGIVTPANYAAWVANGKPIEWCCPWQPCGDTNGDGYVNPSDYIAIVANPAQPASVAPGADTNHDGWINPSDYIAIVAHPAQGNGVPCPPLP